MKVNRLRIIADWLWAVFVAPWHRWLWMRLLAHLRYRMLVGLLFLVPIFLTFVVLKLTFDFLDSVLGEQVAQLFNVRIQGLGIVALILLIYVSGLVVPNVIGRSAVRWAENVALRVPLVRQIYGASRELVRSLSGQASTGFNRVVMIEYPYPGLWTFGFLMSMTLDEEAHTMGVVYIPTAPTPTSGWTAILPIEKIYDTNVSVNTLMQMVFSGGIIMPAQVEKRPLKEVFPGPPPEEAEQS